MGVWVCECVSGCVYLGWNNEPSAVCCIGVFVCRAIEIDGRRSWLNYVVNTLRGVHVIVCVVVEVHTLYVGHCTNHLSPSPPPPPPTHTQT